MYQPTTPTHMRFIQKTTARRPAAASQSLNYCKHADTDKYYCYANCEIYFQTIFYWRAIRITSKCAVELFLANGWREIFELFSAATGVQHNSVTYICCIQYRKGARRRQFVYDDHLYSCRRRWRTDVIINSKSATRK